MAQKNPNKKAPTTSSSKEPPIQQQPDLDLITINDFSPGVVSYARGGLGIIQAPYAELGSAATSQRCINQAGIGLIPLPTYSHQHNIGISGGGTSVVSTGLYAAGPNQPTTNVGSGGTAGIVYSPEPLAMYADEMIYLAINCINTSTGARNCDVYRLETNGSVVVFLTSDQISRASAANQFWRGIVFQEFITSVTVNSFGVSNALRTLIVYPSITYVNNPAGSNDYSGTVIITPNPTTTAEYQYFPIPVTDNNTPTTPLVDMVVSYNARLMALAGSPVAWTYYNTGNSVSQISAFVNNAALFITDPPQTFTWATLGGAYVVQSNFDESELYEIGAFGSQSSGELLLIKAGGGALYVSGDLATPSITKLPAVTGTGKQHGRAVSTPVGLVYLSDSNGAWAWNGSNTSQKISQNIPDDALQAPISSSIIGPFSGATTFHECWNDWIMFANNWLYDTNTDSWWQIEDPSAINFSVWSKSSTQTSYIWCMPFAQANNNIDLYLFDSNIPATSWLWISNPIPASVGSLIEIAWIEILASNTSSTQSTITVTPEGLSTAANNPSQGYPFIIPPNTSNLRLSQTYGFNAHNIQLQVQGINGTSPNAAPILHEINIGYRRTDPTAQV